MYDFTACIVTYNTPKNDLKKIIKCFQKIKLNFKFKKVSRKITRKINEEREKWELKHINQQLHQEEQ